MQSSPTLRERKKAQTRLRLIAAATDLFTAQGYEATTLNEIAAAAQISQRTFFSYFPSKEAILFADTGGRVDLVIDEIASRRPEDTPIDVLLRAVDTALAGGELLGDLGRLRVRLIRQTPTLHGTALRHVLDAQTRISKALAEAYTGQVDELHLAALVGVLVGALVATVTSLLATPDRAEQVMTNPEETLREIKSVVWSAIHTLSRAPGGAPPPPDQTQLRRSGGSLPGPP